MLKRVWRKGNPPTQLMGMQIGTTTMENSMEVPQKTKYRTTIPLLDIYLDKTIIQKDTCTSSHHGSVEMNLTSIHEHEGSIPGLTQWVKDSALP